MHVAASGGVDESMGDGWWMLDADGGWRLAPPDMQISVAIAANYSSAVQVLTEQLLVFIGVPMGL